MTRTGGPDQALQAVHLFLTARLDEADARRDKGDKKHGPYAVIAAHCRTHGTEDENGSYTWIFDKPIIIDGIKHTGFRLQAKQPSPYWEEEGAQALINSLGPGAVAAATRTEIVYDYDYLYLLLQQGQITRTQLDPVIITPPKEFSLTVLEGK